MRRPRLHCRRPAQVPDELDLLPLHVAHQDGLAVQQLPEHAARRPHVHRRSVVASAQQQLRRTVPQRDHAVGERVLLAGRGHPAGQPPVGNAQLQVPSHQNVGRLEVAVQHPVAVDVVQPLQQLLHERLDVERRQHHTLVVQKRLQVVLAILEHHHHAPQVARVLVGLRARNVSKPHNVGVVESAQQLDLAHSRDREPFLLILEQHLLERHQLARVSVAGLVHLTVSALTDLLLAFERRVRALPPPRSLLRPPSWGAGRRRWWACPRHPHSHSHSVARATSAASERGTRRVPRLTATVVAERRRRRSRRRALSARARHHRRRGRGDRAAP
mmetsp:Transcript_6291/g.20034  ORF Transcript_6291/g.20034 Transcript_6291/m.20034 type:complete len:330 (-) Transcript_6291:876-1865(-)